MKKIWFKAKTYGWGWTPATWEGWLVLAVYIGLMVWVAEDIDTNSHSASDAIINFTPRMVVLTAVLIWVCWKKGERPRWRWGKEK